jgi:gamma-tubulin complex component 5
VSRDEEWRRAAWKTLLNNRSVRTNQFEVEARLAGLEEKFRIVNNDPLADALRLRLDELSACSNRWTPEILSLLLNLADRPAEKSDLKGLESLKPQQLPASLTWSEILADDPLDNSDGLWDDIDYAVGDSDDENNIYCVEAAATNVTPDSSQESENLPCEIEQLMIAIDPTKLQGIVQAQSWNADQLQDHQQSKRLVSEAQVFRDVLSMLHGLPTSIFVQIEDGRYLFSRQFQIDHLSEESLVHILSDFAVLGSQLTTMRAWLDRIETVPLQQTYQAAIAVRLQDFDRKLSNLEASTLKPAAVTSLLDLSNTVRRESRCLQQLSKIVARSAIRKQAPGHFDMLEMTYESTCANQACGDTEGYKYMAELLLEGFTMYLKPVRRWMVKGELIEDDKVFFVRKNANAIPLESLWAEQYAVRKTDAGDLYAPNFLRLAAQKIFNAGKIINFLKALGQNGYEDSTASSSDSELTFEVINHSESLRTSTPFSELLERALGQWISKHCHASSAILRQVLDSQFHLQGTLDALEYVFLHRDGALSSHFSYAVFARLDRDKGVWNDKYILTELIREALDPILGAHDQRLTVHLANDQRATVGSRRSVKALECLQVFYSIPWPVANIVRSTSLVTYQRIFVLLLQSQRVRRKLTQQQLDKRTLPSAHCQNGEFNLARLLRHRLLWFTNCVLTYLAETVIAVSTAKLREESAKAEDMDRLIAIHSDYILRLEERCLLSKKLSPIHQALISVFDLAMSFADAHAAYTTESSPGEMNDSARLALNGRQAPHVKRRRASSLSSDDSIHDREQEAEGRNKAASETTYLYRLRKMHTTFANLHSSILAGLQGVHRAGADPTLEALADLLAVGFSKGIRSSDSHE